MTKLMKFLRRIQWWTVFALALALSGIVLSILGYPFGIVLSISSITISILVLSSYNT